MAQKSDEGAGEAGVTLLGVPPPHPQSFSRKGEKGAAPATLVAWLTTCLPGRNTSHQHIGLSTHQFISSSVHQFISSSVHQFISSSVHQFISSSVHQF
ncbi:hypothetical protein ACTFBY_22110, partial [Aeromonas dhakensis]